MSDDFDASDDPTPPINRLIAAWPRLFKKGATRSPSDLPSGWLVLASELCRQLDAQLTDDDLAILMVAQVKEKFGGLRFHVSVDEESCTEDAERALIERVQSLIRPACEASEQTCQECGQPGATGHFGGYVLTVCPTHARELERKGHERRRLTK